MLFQNKNLNFKRLVSKKKTCFPRNNKCWSGLGLLVPQIVDIYNPSHPFILVCGVGPIKYNGTSVRLVGPVSVYCDWVRQLLWASALSHVWQHIICLGFGLRLRPRTGLIRIQDVNSYLKEKKKIVDRIFLYNILSIIGYLVRSLTTNDIRTPFSSEIDSDRLRSTQSEQEHRRGMPVVTWRVNATYIFSFRLNSLVYDWIGREHVWEHVFTC